MKITALNPPFLPHFSRGQRSPAVTRSGTLYYPIWLSYAVGALEQAGHEVQFIDSPAMGLGTDETIARIDGFAPDLVVIEDIYSLEKYPGSGIQLGKVSGVLLVSAFRAGAKVEEIAVREAKKIICGNGNADKFQMERAIRHFLDHPEPIRPFHASDALGLAITGYFRYRKTK